MIIGICGTMHSGKSTLARYLAREIDGAEIASLATPIKELAHSITQPRTGEDAEDKERIRPLYQAIGEVMKSLYGRNYWLNIFSFSNKAKIHSLHRHVIIDDIRFPFEARFVQDNGGYVVKIERHFTESPHSEHVSETAVSDITANMLIKNIGTHEDLRGKANSISAFVTAHWRR